MTDLTPSAEPNEDPPRNLSPLSPTQDRVARADTLSPSTQAMIQCVENECAAAREDINPQVTVLNANVSHISGDMPSQLLKLAKDAGNAPVQIPGFLLASLLTGMSSLECRIQRAEQRVKCTEEKLAFVTADLSALQTASSITSFRRFPKLPLELRKMVWTWALYTPRVVSLGYRDYDSEHGSTRPKCRYFPVLTPPSSLRRVCQESRGEALRIFTPLLHGYDHKMNAYVPHEKNIFFNNSVDTIFMTNDATDSICNLNEMICELQGFYPPSLRKVAFRLTRWIELNFDETEDWLWLMQNLQLIGIEEVILVAGTREACNTSSITFIEPTKSPEEHLSDQNIAKLKNNMSWAKDTALSWAEMGDYLQSCVQEAKDQRYEDTQNILNGELVLNGLDGFEYLGDGEYLEDGSEWKFKKFTFMEATALTEVASNRETEELKVVGL